MKLLDKVQSKDDVLTEKFDDTKGVMGSRKSNDRQYNYQKKKTDKGTNNGLQNTTNTTKDRTAKSGKTITCCKNH